MHPEIVRLGPLTIYSYGVMIALAFIAAILLSLKNFRRIGRTDEMVYDLALVIMVSSLIGARLCYVLVSFSYFLRQPLEIFMVYKGGLVYYGGFVGALVGGYIWVRIRKERFLNLADVVMPSLVLGQALGRIGCFFNGCCYGQRTEGIFGIVFPSLGDHVPRLPTQLIESFFCLTLFLVLQRVFSRRRFEGQVAGLYCLLYGGGRFLIEFLRDDPRGPSLLGIFSVSQFISLLVVAAGSWLLLRRKKRSAESRV
ncbi:MAG: prolipoprotein diacylglyceryl transferase [Candidatus Wallbacteria bacterium]|nr:prolipoprotein diacylglyceryl transferase [Candidatus Wallbacteria bacterium]